MKKCSYCQDKFNWGQAVPIRCLSVTVQGKFQFTAMVHMHRWHNSRIENYQKCKVMKDIHIVQ